MEDNRYNNIYGNFGTQIPNQTRNMYYNQNTGVGLGPNTIMNYDQNTGVGHNPNTIMNNNQMIAPNQPKDNKHVQFNDMNYNGFENTLNQNTASVPTQINYLNQAQNIQPTLNQNPNSTPNNNSTPLNSNTKSIKGEEISYKDFVNLQGLGSGSFGSVLKVLCKKELVESKKMKNKAQIFAMKIMNEDVDLTRSLDEINFLKKLNHKNVLKYFGHFKNDKGCLCIITKLAENGDLENLIELYKNILDTKIPEEIIWRYFFQSMDGLKYIHEQGIAHRDIKPANLFFTDRKEVTIGDFGIAKKMTNTKDENDESDQEGTLKYKAIEISFDYEGDKRKSDIFSMGMTFYELATFTVPTKKIGKELSECKCEFIENNPEKTKYSKELFDLLFEMMEPLPEKRPSADEVYQRVSKIYLEKYSRNTSLDAAFRCFHSSFFISSFFIKPEFDINPKEKPIAKVLKNAIDILICSDNKEDWNKLLYETRPELTKLNLFFEVPGEIGFIPLMCFLQKRLHSELNVQRTKLELDESERTSGCNYTHHALKIKKEYNSIISNKSYGQIKYILKCNGCGEEFSKYDIFLNLSFDLLHYNTKEVPLLDCFEKYIKTKEDMDTSNIIICPKCKRIQGFSKERKIYYSPDILLIFFEEDIKENIIDFPINNLKLSNFVVSYKNEAIYDLISVVNQIDQGNKTNGYVSYESFHRTPFNQKNWYWSDSQNNFNKLPDPDLKDLYNKMRNGSGVTKLLIYQKRSALYKEMKKFAEKYYL